MNEGEFPRATGDAGLNHMLAEPCRGDRDARTEDRYLFLEALMSARERLHISYVGEGVRDGKPRNPAAPLAELLQFLQEQHALEADDGLLRPWFVRHPLQLFDARYYRHDNERLDDGVLRNDPRFFSYADTFANLPASSSAPEFVDTRPEVAASEHGAEVSLADLKRFWRDPAKQVLRDGAGLSLEALDAEVWPDREPLEAKTDRRERIERRLLFDALGSWRVRARANATGLAGPIGNAGGRRRRCAGICECTQLRLELARRRARQAWR